MVAQQQVDDDASSSSSSDSDSDSDDGYERWSSPYNNFMAPTVPRCRRKEQKPASEQPKYMHRPSITSIATLYDLQPRAP